MKNIINKILLKSELINKIFVIINILFIYSVILYINIGSTFICISEFNYECFSFILFKFGIVSFILFILYKLFFNRKIKLFMILILLLGVLGFISYNFAFDNHIALYGMDSRNEGLLVILSYYSFFLLGSTIPRDKLKYILYLFIISGLYQMFLGFIQIFQITNIFGYDRSMNWSTNFKFASGSFGNPNFYSTYMLMCLMIVFGILLKEKKQVNFIIYIILFITFLFGLFMGSTSSCLLAFTIIFIICFIRKINKNNILSVSVLSLFVIFILINSIFILNKITHKRIQQTFNKEMESVLVLLKKGITDDTGNGRIYIWKNSLKKIDKYYLTGIGIDNFGFIDDGTYLCTNVKGKYQCFDKAHNEYIQILMTEGVFTLIVYLLLAIYTIYMIIKSHKLNDKYLNGISLAIIAYLIQAFFNISVINVAPIFYLLLGFIDNSDNFKKINK